MSLKLSQNLTRRKQWGPEKFAAGFPVEVEVEVIDRFVEPLFRYIWRIDGQTTITEMPHMELIFNSTADNYVELYSIASINVTDSHNASHSVKRNSTTLWKRLTIKGNWVIPAQLNKCPQLDHLRIG